MMRIMGMAIAAAIMTISSFGIVPQAGAAELALAGVLDCAVRSAESDSLYGDVDISCVFEEKTGEGNVQVVFGVARFSGITTECACEPMIWLVFAPEGVAKVNGTFRTIGDVTRLGFTFTREALVPSFKPVPVLQPVSFNDPDRRNLAARAIELDLSMLE